MTARDLSKMIEAEAARRNVEVTTTSGSNGHVWTTPEWTAWPAGLVEEIEAVAGRSQTTDGDCWTPHDAE
jgi:hypothetical protein